MKGELVLKRFRLTTGFGSGVLLLLMAALIAFALFQLRAMQASLDTVVSEQNRKTNIVTDMQVAGYHRSDSLYSMLLQRDPFERDALYMEYNRAGFAVGSARVAFRELSLNSEERAVYDRQTDLIEEVVQVQDTIVDLLTGERYAEAESLMLHQAIPMQAAINDTFDELRQLQQAITDRAVAEAHAAHAMTRNVFFAIGAGILAVGALVAIAVFRTTSAQAATIARNVRDLRDSHRRLEQAANHDHLTGLPNRAFFQKHMEKLTRHAAAGGPGFTVFYFDLDRFKQVNDTLGHHGGDALLRAAARRIQSSLRKEDLVARLGGDEFVAVAQGVSGEEEAASIARKVIQALAEPFQIEGAEARVGTSIGISVYPVDGRENELLIRQADDAMYRAKRNGRNGYCFAGDGCGGLEPVSAPAPC